MLRLVCVNSVVRFLELSFVSAVVFVGLLYWCFGVW